MLVFFFVSLELKMLFRSLLRRSVGFRDSDSRFRLVGMLLTSGSEGHGHTRT